MLAVYGGCVEHLGVVCVRTSEELRAYLGKRHIVARGKEALAEELGAAFFTEEEWGEFVGFFQVGLWRGRAHGDRGASGLPPLHEAEEGGCCQALRGARRREAPRREERGGADLSRDKIYDVYWRRIMR